MVEAKQVTDITNYIQLEKPHIVVNEQGIESLIYPNGHRAINPFDPCSPWGSKFFKAAELYADAKKRGKAVPTFTEAYAEYAMVVNGRDLTENGTKKLYQALYTELHRRVKEEGITVEPEYGEAVLLDIVPVLTGMNKVSSNFDGWDDSNGIDQIASVTTQILRAPLARDAGGRLVIFSQMCAQYDSCSSEGQEHDQESFSRGMLDQIDSEKVRAVTAPLRDIAKVLAEFDIPITIVTPQITEDPRLMLAMVPATVWTYIDKGEVSKMLRIVGNHAEMFPYVFSNALQTDQNNHLLIHEAPSYAAFGPYGQSIIERTFLHAEAFAQVYDEARMQAYKARGQEIVDSTNWMSLTPEQVQWMCDYLDQDPQRTKEIIATVSLKNGWDEHTLNTFPMLHRALATPQKGILADTVRFYSRENARRAQAKSDEWVRKFDQDAESLKLLEDSDFYPNLPAEEREIKAHELVRGVYQIANIGIGARAIFNVSLYGSFGETILELNNGHDIAIMMPIEEDNIVSNKITINNVWQSINSRSKPAPMFYGRKELRQPFSKQL